MLLPILSIIITVETSRKRPPQMRRLSGRFREVVAYENRTTGDFFREGVRTHLF